MMPQYTVPPDVTVIFLFNPFRGDVLRAVQQQMHRSVQQTPRKLTVNYINPREDPNLFSECDWLVPVRGIPTGRWDTMRFLVYETHPSVETSTAGLRRESESAGAQPARQFDPVTPGAFRTLQSVRDLRCREGQQMRNADPQERQRTAE